MSFKLKVISRTWAKDNYNLFDYDLEKDINVQDLTIKGDGILSRRQNDTYFYPEKSSKSAGKNQQTLISNEDKHLITLKSSGKFTLGLYQPADFAYPNLNSTLRQLGQDLKVIPHPNTPLWKVTPRSESECIQVKENDVIKIGKKMLTVLQVCNGGSNPKKMMGFEEHYVVSNIMNTFISDMDSSNASNRCGRIDEKEGDEEKSERMPCRICLSSSSSRKNPLLALCKCKGSARWIHYDCVTHWISQRIVITEKPHYANIKSRCIKCELCTALIPPTIILDCEAYQLYRFSNIQFDKFVVLEDADGIISMLNFTQKSSFIIGRGHSCDLKLSEITVSRKHMRLFMNPQGLLFVSDFTSKFGTLVQITQPITLNYSECLEVQSGRTHLRLRRIQQKSRIRRFFSKMMCCSKSGEGEENLINTPPIKKVIKEVMRGRRAISYRDDFADGFPQFSFEVDEQADLIQQAREDGNQDIANHVDALPDSQPQRQTGMLLLSPSLLGNVRNSSLGVRPQPAIGDQSHSSSQAVSVDYRESIQQIDNQEMPDPQNEHNHVVPSLNNIPQTLQTIDIRFTGPNNSVEEQYEESRDIEDTTLDRMNTQQEDYDQWTN